MRTPNPGPVYADIALRSQLRQHLLSLPFDGFSRVVARLLQKIGYERVRSAGRRSFRGRNQHTGGTFAGFDLVANLPVPDISDSVPRTVVIALKQYPPATRVWQKQVDGLRGAALRVGASEALLITTSSFSPSVMDAREETGSYNSAATALLSSRTPSELIAPVRLVDGEALLSLLIANRVGVTVVSFADPADTALDRGENSGIEIQDIGGEGPTLDEGFFERVRDASKGNGPSDKYHAARKGSVRAAKRRNGWQLTIDLSRCR